MFKFSILFYTELVLFCSEIKQSTHSFTYCIFPLCWLVLIEIMGFLWLSILNSGLAFSQIIETWQARDSKLAINQR